VEIENAREEKSYSQGKKGQPNVKKGSGKIWRQKEKKLGSILRISKLEKLQHH